MNIPLRQKYRVSQVKKTGASGDHQGSRGGRKRVRQPAPVSRLRTLVLIEGRKRRFEG